MIIDKRHTKRMIRLGGAGFIVLVIAAAGIVLYNANAGGYTLSASSAKNYPDKEDATYYLNFSGNVHTNFINQHVLSGYITNISKHTNYKNVQLNVLFIDSQGKELGSRICLIDVAIPTGDTHAYKLRTNAPAGTKSLKWEVVSAQTYQ